MTTQQQQQLEQIRKGFPFLKLRAAASTEYGIQALTEAQQQQAIADWHAYQADPAHRIQKFVPASGAATRMFKDLFAFLDGDAPLEAGTAPAVFFENLAKAPFREALDDACVLMYGQSVQSLIDDNRHRDVVRALLTEDGLNYGSLPKGLLLFHAYADCVRTPFEEHLAEGKAYAAGADGRVHVQFTVSPQHRPLFESLAERVGQEQDITFSEQKKSTDTIAATPEGEPFLKDDGTPLTRPGGHGALISNLADLDADVVFIKNIDNVVPEPLQGPTVRWKQIIAGVLVRAQQEAFRHLHALRAAEPEAAALQEALHFVEHTLCCTHERTAHMSPEELRQYLLGKLSRPMRVCGMVKNVGEPGGGPFIAQNPDGSYSPQILESTQIDPQNAEAVQMLRGGTHFNPVDLVCALRDVDGKAFELSRYVDPQTGFISQKSLNGRPLQALELPGLWNGAMSDWSTIFVEVPLSTFNPVKTVNDLYRPEHQVGA